MLTIIHASIESCPSKKLLKGKKTNFEENSWENQEISEENAKAKSYINLVLIYNNLLILKQRFVTDKI